MDQHFDVIVAGLGAMGSHCLAECAERGLRVAGFDRFVPPHDQGSSHGRSRIIREAYFEDPIYVPLVQRAYALWARIEARTGRTLYRRTGGLCYGPPEGELVTGARRSAETHALPYELLRPEEIRRRFPAFVVPDDWVGVLEPRAGMLDPEAAIATAIERARTAGAIVRLNEPVLRWRDLGSAIEVETARGRVQAGQLVISAGMWVRSLLESLDLPLVVQRNALYWFEPARDAERFGADRFPVFLGEVGEGLMWYGFPDVGDGVKIALHHHGPSTEPDAVDRVVHATEVAEIRGLVERFMPAANGRLRATGVCTYTNAPDEHFIIDRHPTAERVLVASPCSGHGFKFAPAIGEVLADLLTEGRCGVDLAPFSLSRPALRALSPAREGESRLRAHLAAHERRPAEQESREAEGLP